MTIQDTYRIVVGHDLEETSDEALREALVLGARVGEAEIHVVHVVAGTSPKGMDRDATRLDTAMTLLRAHAAAALGEGPRVPMRLHVRFGEVAATIHQVAVDYDATLVLVGTHGRQGLDRWRHGSVAEELVRTARLPVLVAHAKDFNGLEVSARPDDARPGAELHHDQAMSEVFIVRPSSAHISGLV